MGPPTILRKAKAHPVPPPRGHELEKEVVEAAWKAKDPWRKSHDVALDMARMVGGLRQWGDEEKAAKHPTFSTCFNEIKIMITIHYMPELPKSAGP